MELCILGALGGIGYLLNNKPNNSGLSVKNNGNNIYDSNDILQNRKNEQKLADNLYNKVGDSNVIIPGPPEPYFNKVDFQSNKLPVTYNDPQSKPLFETKDLDFYVEGRKTSGGFNGIDLTGNQIQSLSGQLLDRKEFVHNNMVPFFGGSVKQNVDDYANKTRIENFTGADTNYKQKTEIKPMFNPEANIGNVYGMQNLTQFNRDRYITSNIHNNVQPFEKEYVGPGLNKGYTSKPSGGFQQADTREYSLPKTTNQLRVKTNPKVSYYGRVISGKHIARPSKIGIVSKNKPDRFYINSKDRWFTTVGAQTGAKQRAKIVLKHSNRRTTGLKSRVNPAGPVDHSKPGTRGKVRVSRKIQLGDSGIRNLGNMESKWFESAFDYGKKTIKLVKTKKENVECNKRQMGNVQLPEGSMINLGDIKPTLRNTRKNNITGNARWTSNMQSDYKPGIAFDPNDIAKTTIKETTIDNDHLGVATSSDGYGGYQTNPRNAPNTHRQDTTREYFGEVRGEERGGYEVTKVKAKNTSRQFLANNSYTGGAGSQNVAPGSRKKYRNAKTKSFRQIVSKGRAPGPSGPKTYISKNNINATTKKDTMTNNRRVNERGVISTKVYNSIPQANKCSVTKKPNKVSNEVLNCRLDPTLLKPFKKNPYTQSLHSYVFP